MNGLRATSFDFSSPTVIYLMGFSESTSGVGTTTVRDGKETLIKRKWGSLTVYTRVRVSEDQYLSIPLIDMLHIKFL